MEQNKDTSGSGGSSTSGEGANNEQKFDKSFVDKIKKEKDNYKAKAEELESKFKLQQETDLKAKEQFKTLYEQTQKDLEDTRKALTAKEEMINQGKIQSEINAALLKAGISADKINAAKRLIDMNLVSLDKDTGVIVGAAEAVQALVKEHADLNLFGKKGSVNHQAGASSGTGASNWKNAKTPADMVAQWKREQGRK